MKRWRPPIWLLRDILALLGVLISFWPLMILGITNGFRGMRGKKVPKSAFEDFPFLLAHAEARPDFALWREAYRRLGGDYRVVEFTFVEASDDWNETTHRFQSYQRAFGNLEACARAYGHAFCERQRIKERDVTGSRRPGFPLRSSSFGGHVAEEGKQHRSLSSRSAQHWGRRIAAPSQRDKGTATAVADLRTIRLSD